jgi:quercetin dioxygenase-like cupin family protein
MSAQRVEAGAGEWFDNPDGAGKFRILRLHEDGGATVEVRMQAGTRGKAHFHPKGEELFMLEGEVSIGGEELAPGDYLYTPPGAWHFAAARTYCRFVLVLPALPEYK